MWRMDTYTEILIGACDLQWCILPPLIRLAGDLLDGGDGELNGGSEMVVLRKAVVL